MQVPLFDLYTTFKELTFEEGTEKINFCDAIKVGMTPFFTDLDGSFNPRPNPFRRRRRPSTIMANVPALTQFVQNDRRCMRFDESCALYCRRICFRGIQYSVDQAGTEEYLLKVCDATDPSSCAHFPGYFRGRDPTMSGRARMFNAYLPAGEYTAVFVNSYGEEVWPSYVQTRFQQDELCPMALDDDDIKLLEPPVTEETCTQLLQNQDMENSNDNASPWLHRFGGIQVAPGFGSTMSANALTSKRPAESNTIVQHLDSRCLKLMQDEYYEITAWIKLVDKRGRVYNCDPAVEACPFVGLVEPRGRVSVAQVVQGPNKQGFHRLQGTVQITEAIAYSEEPISLFVRSNVDLAWFIDNVSMRWIDDGTPQMKETPDLLTEDFLGVGGLVTMYGGDFP